jgi:hypothetical protein
MTNKLQNAKSVMVRLFSFLLRVLRDFRRNQGLLLSGSGTIPAATVDLIGAPAERKRGSPIRQRKTGST